MSIPTLIKHNTAEIIAENKIIQEANQAIKDGNKRLDVAKEVSAKIQELYKGIMAKQAKSVKTRMDMATFPYHEPPTGQQQRQLIIDRSPLPSPPIPIYWFPYQDTEEAGPYRVLDSAGEDKYETGFAILFNAFTQSWTYIYIQKLESIMNESQSGSSGIGFKLTFTYVAPPPLEGGKSLYFKTKSTRKSSRRKYFKRKSSKRRIRTKSKYRRQ